MRFDYPDEHKKKQCSPRLSGESGLSRKLRALARRASFLIKFVNRLIWACQKKRLFFNYWPRRTGRQNFRVGLLSEGGGRKFCFSWGAVGGKSEKHKR